MGPYYGPYWSPHIGRMSFRPTSTIDRSLCHQGYKERSNEDSGYLCTVGFRKLENGSEMISAGLPSFFGLGLEDGHIPTFWLVLNRRHML